MVELQISGNGKRPGHIQKNFFQMILGYRGECILHQNLSIVTNRHNGEYFSDLHVLATMSKTYPISVYYKFPYQG
jgi:hypothetical protein